MYINMLCTWFKELVKNHKGVEGDVKGDNSWRRKYNFLEDMIYA
jgi:hypothetical protein